MQEYKTKKVFAGGVAIGGGAPVTVQSMLNIPAHDIAGNVEQAKALEKAGCDIIRISVPDKESVKTLAALKSNISIPVVADIHFDYRLAIAAIEQGADNIEEMTRALSGMFRYSISRKGKTKALMEEELANVNNYLRIQQYRFRNKINITETIDPAAKKCCVRSLPAPMRFMTRPIWCWPWRAM